MHNQETTREYCNLITGFIDKNPCFDDSGIFISMAKEEFETLPRFHERLGIIGELSHMANYIMTAFFMEMNRDRFPPEREMTDMFMGYWQVAINHTYLYFQNKNTLGHRIDDIDEFGDILYNEMDSMINRFLSGRLAAQHNDMNKWLDKVYKTYENKLIFG